MKKRIQVSKNFYLDEFVDPHTYLTQEDNGRAIIDASLFDIAQLLRDLYGRPIFINTWWKYFDEKQGALTHNKIIANIENNHLLTVDGRARKTHKWSGFRPRRCTIGAPASAHRHGKAIDPKGPQHTFYQIVKENAEAFYMLGLRRLEDPNITAGWLHCDTLERNTQLNSIRVVNLKSHVRTIYW